MFAFMMAAKAGLKQANQFWDARRVGLRHAPQLIYLRVDAQDVKRAAQQRGRVHTHEAARGRGRGRHQGGLSTLRHVFFACADRRGVWRAVNCGG